MPIEESDYHVNKVTTHLANGSLLHSVRSEYLTWEFRTLVWEPKIYGFIRSNPIHAHPAVSPNTSGVRKIIIVKYSRLAKSRKTWSEWMKELVTDSSDTESRLSFKIIKSLIAMIE